MKLTCPNISASTWCLRQGLGKHISTGVEVSPSGISSSRLGAVLDLLFQTFSFRAHYRAGKAVLGVGGWHCQAPLSGWGRQNISLAFSSILGGLGMCCCSQLWKITGAVFEAQGGVWWHFCHCWGWRCCSDKGKQEFLKWWLSQRGFVGFYFNTGAPKMVGCILALAALASLVGTGAE